MNPKSNFEKCFGNITYDLDFMTKSKYYKDPN